MPIEIARYAIRLEQDQSFTIYDICTAWPAEYLGRSLDGLREAEARQLCIVVNAIYRHRMRTINQEIRG